ncbi:TipJ family phage tail tip protein [Raoultella planticola]|uniref:TipJ family phage tail tip protein n=1 Tax=Raoultella planticola TaxID=575 RepID=UPI00381DBBF5
MAEIKGIAGAKNNSGSKDNGQNRGTEIASVAYMKILLALSEGEIAGQFTGQDIYLDGTPLLDADGHENFPGVTWEWRSGLVDQDYIQGFPAVENEISVSTEIKSGTPWVKAINNTQLSAVRLRIKFPNGVYSLRDSGGKDGYRIEFAIDVSTDGSTYTEYGRDTVDGIANTGYERSYRIDLPRATSGWQIRVRRLTENKNNNKTADVSRIESITEIVDAKLRYPNTALLFVQFDSTLFDGRTPTVTVKAKGLVIRVPSNYDPVERTYSGSWDGTFKWAWSNNPAWIFYDLVLNKRYGLGKRISSDQVDKWTLYQIGQYCDAPVSDGAGGKEARYLCDLYISQRTDAWTVLMDLANIFRGMISWSNNLLSVDADMPREMDPDFVFNKSNIVGSFTFSSTSERTNYSAAIVTYSNPQNNYQDDQASVYSQEVADRFGFNTIELSRIGCTRESEAQRHGAYAIETNRDDNGVEFKTGMEGRIPRVGKVIGINNAPMAGRQNGGRVAAVSGKRITLDRAVAAKAGDTLIINLPDGKSQGRKVQSAQDRIVTVEQEYNPVPQAEAGWVLDQSDLAIQQFRVKRVVNNNDGTVTISGLPYNPNKFPRVDDGAVIEDRPVTVIPPRGQEAPDDITISSIYRVSQGIGITTLVATWSPVKNAIAYEMQWRQNNGDWINLPRTGNTRFEVDGIYAGRYVVRVRAINAQDIASVWGTSKETELTGKSGAPLPPLSLTTVSLTAGIEIRWEFPAGSEDTQRTELQYSPDQSGNGALPLTDLAYPGKQYQQMGLQIATHFWYRARLVDRLGNVSPWTCWVQGMSSDNVDDYYQQIDDAIRGSDTFDELNKGIQDNSAAAEAAQKAADEAKSVAEGAAAENAEQQKLIDDQGKAIAQNVNGINNAAKAGVENANKLAQEILDRQVGDLTTANKAASDVANAIKKAETDDAEVAKQAADNLLNTKSEVEAQISTINTTMQDGFDSLAQQMASISAGTGEQFDSLKIWYFDKGAEGWAEDDANTKLLPVDSDGWVYPAGVSSTMRSPNPLAIDGQSYKYIRLRIKRVGNPDWNGKLFWVGVNETGWSNNRSFTIPAPDFDPATGFTVLSIPDLLWATSGTIRRLRLDFSTNQDANNYYVVDWMAVGRPTPGASQAQIQDLKTAMTAADAAEALARSQLAVQLRGNYEGTDPANLVTGLVYNERVARVTAEQAIAADVTTLRTDFNSNKAAVTQRLDTLTSENQAQAQSLTQLQSGLTDANGKIGANSTAINQLKTDVTAIDGRVTANSQLLTGLQSDLNNIRVGGTNLIPNSATLIGVSGVVSGQTYKGNAIKRLAIAAASSAQYDQLEFVLDAPVDGTECVVSFYAKGMNAASTQIYTYLYNPNATLTAVSSQGKKGSWSTGGDGSMIIDLTTDWQRYWVKYTRKAGQTGTQRVIFGRLLKGSVDREVYISSPKFEYGTMPTEWSEAPADNASATALQALTTRVTAAEGSITTNSQAITQLKGDLSTVQGQLANKAEASALQQLQTTVSQQGQTLASQGSAITDIQNNLQNGKKGYWLLKVFDIKKADGSYIPSLADLNGVPPLSVSEMVDASRLDFLSYGDYKFLYVKALAYVTADKTISLNPGARIADDTARLYINGTSVTTMGPALVKFDIQLKKGWNTIEFVTMNWTGQSYLNFGLKISANVDQMFSGAGQLAAASASQVLSSQVEQTAGKVDANSSAITTLSNSVEDINTALNTKADAAALTALTTRVTNAEGKLTTQGGAITQLTNDLSAANGKITANANAITGLTTRVTAAEGKIDSQAQSIISISSSIKGSQSQAANLIPNPTFDPAYSQMGMTVISSTSEGVPEGCPYAYVVKCAFRDHLPAIDNIPCHEGQVFELSVLAACGTGIAPFQHYIGTSTQTSGGVGSPMANGGQISAATGAQWTRTTWRWKVNAAQAAKGFFRPFLQISQSGPDYGTIWYATDWSVRDVTAAAQALDTANANASAITQLTTRVTSAEGKITSQGSALTQLTNDVSNLTGIVNQKADAAALTALTTRVTQAEGRLETQGSAITQLTNNLSNTDASIDAAGKIPGNLLANNSFERGQAAFNGWNARSTVMAAQVPHTGKNILKMAAGGSAGIGQDVVITKGRRYRFGVWAKQDSGTVIQDAGNTKFRIADSTGLLIGVNYGPFTSTWQHVSMDWTATKDTTAAFQLTTWLSAGAMYFDDVYVVDITNETQIHANADAITTLNTKVTQQGNVITSQGNAMTSLTNALNTLRYANSNPWFDGSLESYANNQQLSGANCFVTESYKLAGNRSLQCRRADGETGNSDKTIGVRTAIRENAVYRFELWAMMPESETPPTGWTTAIGINVQDPSGNNAWNIAVNITEAGLTAGGGRGKWVKFTGKAAMTGSKTRGVVWISTRGASGGPGYSIYLDDVVITDITDANAAQVTADANASAITGLTTRVSNAEGKITSQGDAITKLTNNVSVIDGKVNQKADASAVNALATRVTGAEGSITTQGQAITQLSNSIDAARNTGENLVQNFDFTQGETAYNFQRNSGTAGSMVNIGAFGDGKPGAQMVRVNGTSPGLFANNKKPVPVDGRRKYRYVVKAKGVSGAMNMLLRRWNYNGSTEGSYEDKNNTLTNDWQVITWETNLTPANGVDGVSFGIYCHPANAEIWIDSFRVYDITDEVNIKATADALQVLTNTVTQQGNQITAQSNALTQLSSSLNNDAAAMATSPGNLLVNPGFERGTALWSGWNNYVDVYAATNPRTGANILRGKAGGIAAIGQNIIGVKKDRTYRFGGFVRRNTAMSIGATGNNKFRLGNADTGAGPVSELNFSQSNVATTWTLLTKDWKATADMTVVFSVNFLLTAGEIYFDDVFFVDVTDSLATEGNSTALNSLTTRVTNAEGKITANTTAISNMTSRVGNAEAAIDGLNETTAANGLAMAAGFNQMRSMIGDNSAAITTTNKTVADLEKSTTEQVTTLTSRIGDMSSTVQQTASTIADLNGKLGAQWGVKVNTSSGGKNYVAGIQLGIDGSGQSQFLVQADQFGVYVPNGDKSNLVFGVDGNGAYMQQAMARNLVIDFAQITNNIQSTNYVDGSQGWAINKNGGAQFNNAIFRGHIEAQSGYFSGTVYANKIEGDVMIGEAGTVNPVDYGSSLGSGEYDLFYISGENFDRFIDTNLIVQMTSTFRSYGDIVVSTPGQPDYVHFSWDAGNNGGTCAISLKGLLIRAAGRGQKNRVFVRATNGRGLGIKTYLPRVENADGNTDYSGVQREKFVITAFRTGARIAAN